MMKNCRSHSLWALATLACAALSLPVGADEARAPLPDPDGRPADMSKPVQVYILMGQSNMLGAGNIGKLSGVVKSKRKYPYLVDEAGNWTVRKDVRNVRVKGAHIPAGANARLNVMPDLANRSSTGVRRVRSDDTARPACIRVPVPYQDMSSARTKTKLGRSVLSAASAVFGVAAISVIAIAVSAISVASEQTRCDLFMWCLSRLDLLAFGFGTLARLGQQRVHLAALLCKMRFGREVVVFVRIVDQVVQLGLIRAAPFGVTPTLRADRSAQGLAPADHRVRGRPAFCARVFQQGHEALALQFARPLDAAQFHERVTLGAVPRQPGHADDHRYPRAFPIGIPILRSHRPATSDSHQLMGNNPQQRCIENQREYDNAFHVFTLSMY